MELILAENGNEELIENVLEKTGVRGQSNKRACVKRLRNVSETRVVCQFAYSKVVIDSFCLPQRESKGVSSMCGRVDVNIDNSRTCTE